jgi:hypothetical protein
MQKLSASLAAVLAAECEKLAQAETEAGIERGEIMIHQVWREIVVAGRHGRVRSEDEAGGGEDAGFGETEMLRFHQGADAFKGKKRGMAFVHVINGGVQTESFEGADAANA